MRYEFNKTLTKCYYTFEEFVSMSETMEKDSSKEGELGWGSSDREGSSSFYGDANSHAEMVQRCYDGYNAKGVTDKRVEINNLIDYNRPTDTLCYVGDDLDIPTYLSGEMRCWWADDGDSAKPPKRVHLTYSANCIANVNADSFYNHGGAVCAIADALDAMGCQVKVTCTFTNTDVFTGEGLQAIEIKDYCEIIDVPRIGATTHPSFFRRIGFRHFERWGKHIGKVFSGSYGCSRTGSSRHYVVGDDEFADWLRIDPDEIVIDLPAADVSVFKDTNDTAEWVLKAVETIERDCETIKHIKIWS